MNSAKGLRHTHCEQVGPLWVGPLSSAALEFAAVFNVEAASSRFVFTRRDAASTFPARGDTRPTVWDRRPNHRCGGRRA